MAERVNRKSVNQTRLGSTSSQSEGPKKPWRRGALIKLNKSVTDELYPMYYQLPKKIRQDAGLMMKIPVFIKDPLVALENPTLGVQEIYVRLEKSMDSGPTSSRIAVVDFNADTQTLLDPVVWDEVEGWFHTPLSEMDWLPDSPRVPEDIYDPMKIKDPGKYLEQYHRFIEKTVKNPYFHQVNAWAVVQRVLEFYEEPWALGRPVPWGFDGNRLIVIPHAGYGETAFYDRESKSLQFFYSGDQENPGYTCLSHDEIAHVTGKAILDGIRPMYYLYPSVQTAAFYDFIGDLTAILVNLFNQDIRRLISKTSERLQGANAVADLAMEFGQEVVGRDYLRTAFNNLKMKDVENTLVPHTVSQVLTGAMWDILIGIATKRLCITGRVTASQALWWAVDRFRRIALQPLDLCPPCDIQFIDYAKAVIRNDVLTNPVDVWGYRSLMLDVFHKRGLCDCGYKPGLDLPPICKFQDALHYEKFDFIFIDPERLSLSKTAAIYFVNDNLDLLHIPPDKNFRIVDLYDNNKLDADGNRLSREIVLEYAWQEEVILEKDQEKKLDFRQWIGKSIDLNCGGTLVFDNRGELLSLFRNPGTEHPSKDVEDDIRRRLASWEHDPAEAKKQRIKKPTKYEMEALEDLAIGRQRKKAILTYLSALIQEGNLDMTVT